MAGKNASIRMDTEKLARVDSIAKAVNRSRAWVINQAVDRYLEYEEWFVQQVQQGLDEADQGQFATDQEVKKRFAKWGVKIEG
jgi:predicted transcriptional regulator